jgi:hypothetical protein
VIEAAEKKEQYLEKKGLRGGRVLCAALLFTAVPFICLAVPMYVIRPFRPQVYSQLTAALTIRSLGPWLSAIAAIAVLAIIARAWSGSRRVWLRLAMGFLCLLVIAGACLTNVNIFEVMFHPYASPTFTDSVSAQVDSDDKVLAIKINGDARAYPIRTMGYHHIVNDTVGGTPLAVTYCTLCHTGLVWSRTLNGKTLHFRLAGINNGNALMRDEETSTIWQQSTGEAIFGPWKGQHLGLIHSDEMTFALWRAEQPKGVVLKPDPQYATEYDPKDWEKHVEKTRTVIDTSKSGIAPHELMLGVTVADRSKAYPLKSVLAAKLIQDQIGEVPLLIVVGPDGASIRLFKGTLGTSPMTFIAVADPGSIMRDVETGSDWNFEGCAVAGKLTGQCLQALDGNKDYWFDWLNHHPKALLYRG